MLDDFDDAPDDPDEPESDPDFDDSDDFDDDESEDPLDDSDDFEPFDDSELDPGGVVDFEPRLSVLKKPEPLKVTPTGWKTFLTGSRSPESGWVYSVSVSSVNACWTSMVSPDSTNL